MGNRAFCSASMCPKASLHPAGETELFDDTNACDSAGTIFNETLEDLNEVDRLLLVFASSFNLSAVRWLLVLGANAEACDTNGTTCLHAACRSGSLGIVREFIQRDLPLDAADVAGWTPLHVALFMGRRSVAIELMQCGADLAQRNARGLSPSDLCSDMMLREAIDSCLAHRHLHGLQRPWEFGREAELGEDVQITRLRFEPFFVPRAPVLRDAPSTAAMQRIGVEIFNQRPGQGLAFLVSSGAVRDFPVELSNFLAEHAVSLMRVGEYLGEDFSLSQTLRLEYINSVRLMGTGVVSCLAKVFKQFQIPSEMQKIDRLIDGVAQIWWRQHESLREKASAMEDEDSDPFGDDSIEVEGLTLMKHLRSHDNLHQLMFSAVMLHWNLYAPLPQSQRVTKDHWLRMNAGCLHSAGTDSDAAPHAALRHICVAVYNMLSKTFYPQLQIWSKNLARSGGLAQASADTSHGTPAVAVADDKKDMLVEGWALLVGGGFPSLVGSTGTITYRHIRSILSETTSTAFALTSPDISRQHPGDVLPPSVAGFMSSHDSAVGAARARRGQPGEMVAQSARQDWVWMSVRQEMLFLAPKPNNWAPYAFVHLRGVAVQHVERSALILTLAADASLAKPTAAEERGRGARPTSLRCGGARSPGAAGVAEGPFLQLVFLLPDGRWQVLELPCLRVQVPDLQQLERWQTGLASRPTAADAEAAAEVARGLDEVVRCELGMEV